MSLEERLKKIEERNKKVELDKEWETSWTRKICIMLLTYIVVIIYSYLIRKIDNIFFSSLVPVIGFTLSTLSLKLIRKIWEVIIKNSYVILLKFIKHIIKYRRKSYVFIQSITLFL